MLPYLYSVYTINKETNERKKLGLYTAEEITDHFEEADDTYEIIPYISSLQGSYFI
jgi:hypothetical protein